LRSKLFAGLAWAYAQYGRVQEALRYLKEARSLFFGETTTVPVFISTEYGLHSLILSEGCTLLDLGKHDPDQGYYQQSEEALAQIVQLPTNIVVPERIIAEITNQQALAAIKVNNLENFEKSFIEGIRAANMLGSQKRRQEAIANWKEARKVWPNEKRVTELADLFF
jgi:tetratricopeptide (TPR) repeat protein